MPQISTLEIVDDEEYLYALEEREMRRRERRKSPANAPVLADSEHFEGEDAFNPSYAGSRHEREWILTYLRPFYDDQLISDVLYQVKGGKEATVYCCRAHPATGLDLIAAKVYRPRMFRNLRNDAQYRQGRAMLDADGKPMRARRETLAMQKGTRFGKELSHGSWLSHEFGTLQMLHELGADVPRPLSQSENALLIEYIGDDVSAAPTLNGVNLDPDEAAGLFERIMRNVELMLSRERIHGDLSAYNILYWQGDVTIIDFPQVINAFHNPDAPALFARDVERVCQYFEAYGVGIHPYRLAERLWKRHMPGINFKV